MTGGFARSVDEIAAVAALIITSPAQRAAPLEDTDRKVRDFATRDTRTLSLASAFSSRFSSSPVSTSSIAASTSNTADRITDMTGSLAETFTQTATTVLLADDAPTWFARNESAKCGLSTAIEDRVRWIGVNPVCVGHITSLFDSANRQDASLDAAFRHTYRNFGVFDILARHSAVYSGSPTRNPPSLL